MLAPRRLVLRRRPGGQTPFLPARSKVCCGSGGRPQGRPPGRVVPVMTHIPLTQGAALSGGAPPFPGTPFGFTWWLVRQVPKRAALLLAITVTGTGLQSLAPYAVGGLIDAVEQALWEAVPVWFVLLVLAWLVGPLITRFYTLANAFTMTRMRAIGDRALFAHTIGQATRFFSDNFVGSISQRIRRGANTAPQLFEAVVSPMARFLTSVTVAAILLAVAAGQYALGFLAFAVVFVAVTVPMARLVVKRTQAHALARSRVTGRIADGVANADVIRSFAAWRLEELGLEPLSEAEYRCARDVRISLTLMRVAQLCLSVGFMSLIVWIALAAAQAGGTTPGEIAMILTVGVQLGVAITQLGDDVLSVFEHVGELGDSLDALSAPHEIPDAPDAVPLAPGPGGVEFDDLTFHYPDGTTVFRNLGLRIQPGERVGIVGRSGAGKSTLVRLLTRRHVPTAGVIRVDGQDLAQVTRVSLCRAIGEVPQTTEMFHRSIRDNVGYGRPDATAEDVERAARDAGAHGFILDRPNGYEAVVGEKGVKLSGGERQRIAVARAFLKDAPILLLDEATSSLDTETEIALQSALWRLMHGRTVVAIAHRLSTLRAMDRIVVLDEGVIVEEGRPADLIATSGAFARAWQLQHNQDLAAE